MPGTRFKVTSQRIQAEQAAKRIGVARVNLHVLAFPNSRSLDIRNVERLKSMFSEQRGCEPDELPNRIPAVIDEATLNQALERSGLSREALQSSGPTHPTLQFPPGMRLQCLRGQHRVLAAKEMSKTSQRYWTVDLFISDISNDAKQDLVDEYASEKEPDDGEFYYKIRRYQGVFGQENLYFERRWWARLASKRSTNSRDRLEQLLRHRKFAPAFDAFRHLPALYSGLRLSAVNKMIAMRCDEELLLSLRGIKEWYYYVFDGNEEDMEKLDTVSNQALELSAPGACEADAKALRGEIRAGQVLGAFSDQQREAIWARILSATVDNLVPSLTAFFDNLKYPRPIANSVKRLIRVESRETIRSALELSFVDEDHDCLIQTSRYTLKSVPCHGSDVFDIAYRTLWLYAAREYPEMPPETKRKLAGSINSHANERVLFEFAALAYRLGFRSEQIDDLRQRDPDRQIARRLLLTARDSDRFEYIDLEACVTDVTRLIKIAQAIRDVDMAEDVDMESVGEPNRSGQPRLHDQTTDKEEMFLDKLHRVKSWGSQISSLFVQRSMYFGFLGKGLEIDMASLDTVHEEQTFADQNFTQDEFVMSSRLDADPPELLQQDGSESRLENLRGNIAVQEARLEELTAQEMAKRDNALRLQEDMEAQQATFLALTNNVQELQGRLGELQQAEAEQVIRLEELKTDEARRRAMTELGDRIRLDLIPTDQMRDDSNNETVQRPHSPRGDQTSDELHAQTARNQEILQELIASIEERKASLGQLEVDKRRLQSVIAETTEIVRQADATEMSRGREREVSEKEHTSTVTKLVEREAGLRAEVQRLEAELQRLQERIDQAEAEEKELKSKAEALKNAYQLPPGSLGQARRHEEQDALPVQETRQETPGLERLVRDALDFDEERDENEAVARTTDITEQEPQSGMAVETVAIDFKMFEDTDWQVKHTLLVDPQEPSELKRVLMKYVWKDFGIFTRQGRTLSPLLSAHTLFERVTSAGTILFT